MTLLLAPNEVVEKLFAHLAFQPTSQQHCCHRWQRWGRRDGPLQDDRLQRDAAELRAWLADHPHDRLGPSGSVRKSNRTDPDSAKMATGKGVIQGYCGVAAVDARHQIIIAAQAHGTGSEQELLVPIVDALGPHMQAETLLTVDAGYHSEDNLTELDKRGINALIADNQMRQRDERFAGQAHHKDGPDPLHDKSKKTDKPSLYKAEDFTVAPDQTHCICPAGKKLHRNGKDCTIGGYAAVKFRGAARDCSGCSLRTLCLRKPDTTKTRQVAILTRKADAPPSHTERMRQRIDSPEGRALYAGRFATVEPVFGNLRYNKKLSRFTLRGRKKVDTQWKLYCLVHNIEKLANNGYAR